MQFSRGDNGSLMSLRAFPFGGIGLVGVSFMAKMVEKLEENVLFIY